MKLKKQQPKRKWKKEKLLITRKFYSQKKYITLEHYENRKLISLKWGKIFIVDKGQVLSTNHMKMLTGSLLLIS